MVEKGIRGGLCYAEANNKYMKIMIRTKNHQHLHANNLYE